MKRRILKYPVRQRRGAIIAMVAVLLLVLFVISAFAINLCYMELCQCELQVACDASCRAGARELARTGNQTSAFDKAASIASQNNVASAPLILLQGDVTFGKSNRPNQTQRYDFESGNTPVNAIRINARRTNGSGSGAVPLFLGNILGTTTFQPQEFATATASELDVVLVVDSSGSMAYEPDETVGSHPRAADTNSNGVWDSGEWGIGDPPPVPGNARWNGLLGATSSFIGKLQATYSTEKLAAVKFSDSATLVNDFTTGYPSIYNSLANNSPTGMTAIGEGMYLAIDRFQNSSARRPGAVKVMIVLTDGVENTGRPSADAATLAASLGITVHAVAFTAGASSATCDNIANIGGGMSLVAANNAQLTAAFNKIADSLPVLLTE